MNECTVCRNHPNPIKLDLRSIEPDKKLAFVERVCDLLVESRYNQDRPYRLFVHLSDVPEEVNCTFYDLTLEGLVPSYIIEFIDDEFIEKLTRDMYARRIGIFSHCSPRSSNTARGSPSRQELGARPPIPNR